MATLVDVASFRQRRTPYHPIETILIMSPAVTNQGDATQYFSINGSCKRVVMASGNLTTDPNYQVSVQDQDGNIIWPTGASPQIVSDNVKAGYSLTWDQVILMAGDQYKIVWDWTTLQDLTPGFFQFGILVW